MVLTALAGLIMIWSLVARRVRFFLVTPPIAFGFAGYLLAVPVGVDVPTDVVLFLAELTLVVLLFHDASTVQLKQLRLDPAIAVRLLLIGFPLTLGAIFLVSLGLMPAVGVAGALLIAGALTPTDAGLGAPTIMDPRVPMRVRRALNVESGLNDGLATPIVLLAIAALGSREGGEAAEAQPTIFGIGVVPVALGIAVGVGLGLLAAVALDASRRSSWSTERGRAVGVMAVPLLALGVSEVVGANSFIAAFVCGIAFGAASRCVTVEPEVNETVETAADVLGFVIWFLAGGLFAAVFVDGLRWQWVLLAVLALTVLRSGPVFISMLGSGFRWQTVLFLGWFGPRGLATVVFALIAVEELGGDNAVMADVAGVLALTVVLSVIAHGVTAGPMAARYGSWVAATHGPIETEPSVEPMPSRGRRPQ